MPFVSYPERYLIILIPVQLLHAHYFAVVMIQELLKAYEKQDMYGMADCLMEKAVLFVLFYYGEE